MITYIDTVHDITPHMLHGFMQDWPHPPSAESLLEILKGSDFVVLAVESDSERVIGYITAISDGISCAYIPHLEVLESYRGQGIGSELMRRMLARLDHLYMIDLMCDTDLEPFYTRFGLRRAGGMSIRNYDRQACERK